MVWVSRASPLAAHPPAFVSWSLHLHGAAAANWGTGRPMGVPHTELLGSFALVSTSVHPCGVAAKNVGKPQGGTLTRASWGSWGGHPVESGAFVTGTLAVLVRWVRGGPSTPVPAVLACTLFGVPLARASGWCLGRLSVVPRACTLAVLQP